MAGKRPDRRGIRWLLGGFSVLAALTLHLCAQAGMYFATPGWSLARFRQYYEHDQLGYLAIVKNFSDGAFASVEPDTETGSNYYPRAYYEVIGWLARGSHLDPVVAWNAFGLLTQLLLVGALAAILIALSGHWWLGLLAPLPSMVGTFAVAFGPGWYTTLASHAVIWGPFGVLHALNGETISLSIACLCLFALGWLWLRPHRRGLRVTGTVATCAIIGALANVQTYSFIATVYVLAFVLATWTILSGRHRVLAVVSIALLPVVFLAGPSVTKDGGQLSTLVFGMLPAVPGLVAAVVRTRGMVALYGAALALGAAPQVVATVVGLAAEDPFLVYRVASNSDLGVPVTVGLISGIVLTVPLTGVLLAGILRRQAIWAAYAIGAMIAWSLLATNDQWGANAEPYRIWMDAFFLVAVTLLPLGALVVRELWRSEPIAEVAATQGRPRLRVSARRWIVVLACVLCLGLATASLGDWWRFYRSDEASALMVTDSSRDAALTGLALRSAARHPDALIAVDPCIDPRVLKITSGVRVAYFHLGMAWPAQYRAISRVIAARRAGTLNVGAARQSHATEVLTDSSCAHVWGKRYAADLKRQDSVSYAGGEITLWTLTPHD